MLQRRLIALAREVPWHVAGLASLGLLVSGLYVGQGLLLAEALRQILGGRDWWAITPLLAASVGLIAVHGSVLWLREVAARSTAATIKQRLRRRMYAHLLALGPGYLERTRTGSVQSTLVDGVEAIEGYLSYYGSVKEQVPDSGWWPASGDHGVGVGGGCSSRSGRRRAW
jgi:ATP-binding cassette subfamily C protein CydD